MLCGDVLLVPFRTPETTLANGGRRVKYYRSLGTTTCWVREKEECLETPADKPKQRGFADRQMNGIVFDKFVE